MISESKTEFHDELYHVAVRKKITEKIEDGKFMSVRNKKIVVKFINELLNKNEDYCLNCITEDIKWNIVGMPVVIGKKNFIETMKMMELWHTAFGSDDLSNNNKIISEGEFVVTENVYDYPERNSGIPAHCDIYKLKNGKIKEITTYIVDTSIND